MSQKSKERMKKYMSDTDSKPYLQDFIATMNTDRDQDGADLPADYVELVKGVKSTMEDLIKGHIEKSAGTRQKLVSLPESEWKDPATGTMRLDENRSTGGREVLGYLPKPMLAQLEECISGPYTAAVTTLREQINKDFSEMRASGRDREEVQDLMERDTFFLDDIVQHRKAADYWAALKEKKMVVIEKLTEREEFLMEMDDFEQKASGNKDRYSGTNSIGINDENKFRNFAAKKVVGMDADCIEGCKTFQSETGRLLEIDGVNYLEMIKEQNFGRPSDLKTCLSKLPFEKIKLAQRQKFSGMKVSNLSPAKVDPSKQLRQSLYELNISTYDCIIREEGVDPNIVNVMKDNGFYEVSSRPEDEDDYFQKRASE